MVQVVVPGYKITYKDSKNKNYESTLAGIHPVLQRNNLFKVYNYYMCSSYWFFKVYFVFGAIIPLLIYFYFIFQGNYIYPSEDSWFYKGLQNQIRQMSEYGYPTAVSQWSTFIIIHVKFCMIFSIVWVIYFWPVYLSNLIHSWYSYQISQNLYGRSSYKKFFLDLFWVIAGLICFGGGAYLFFSSSVDYDPGQYIHSTENAPGRNFTMNFAIWLATIFLPFVFFATTLTFMRPLEFIIGNIRYRKAAEYHRQQALKGYEEKEEVQAFGFVEQAALPKDKWDNFDDFWDDK